MVPVIQTCLLLLSIHLVSIYCYNKPQVSSLKTLEPSWESTERLTNERPLSAISERYLKSLESGKPNSGQSNLHSALFQPLQSSLQEEVALSAAPEEKNDQQKSQNARLFLDSIPSFTFAPLQAIASGINSFVQPFVSPEGEIGLGNLFPEITTVYSTYYSSGTQTLTQNFVSTKNTYWTTTTTSVTFTSSSTSTSTTTPVSVSVTTYPSTALLTSSSTASSTTTVTATYTSTSTGTSTSTAPTATTTEQTIYSSTEVQVSTTTLPTKVSTTTVTTTVATVFITQSSTSTDVTQTVTIRTCVI